MTPEEIDELRSKLVDLRSKAEAFDVVLPGINRLQHLLQNAPLGISITDVAADEIVRLRKQNAKLREKLAGYL